MNLLILNKQRKMNFNKNLPSDSLQKEYEINPMKILETIRNEKENEISNKEKKENEKDKVEAGINDLIVKNLILSNKENKKIEEKKINEYSSSFDASKRENQKDENRNKLNNKNIVNNINNINTLNNINCHNTLINYYPNIKFNNNSNIIVNHLNIFFNFHNNNSIQKDFVHKDDNIICNENNIKICKNNKNFCSDNINNNINQKPIFIKNNNFTSNNINKLLNNLKTYKGSIIYQAFIDNINDEKELSLFFQSIIPHICQIMCLEYGNYFFQKLIKKLNIQQKLAIYQIIESEFLVIATNKCGTHSIQSLMDTIETPFEYLALNRLISKNMLLLFTDDNAYHIMMKMILDFPEEKRNILNLYLVTNTEKIIINCNGAFCVNKFITNNKNLNIRKLLVENLRNNIKKIIFNKFSCIILLLVLQTFGIEWGGFIIKEIQQNFIVMSENPISNVFITKVLDYLSDNNILVLKLLIWSVYKNIVLINCLLSNKNQQKLLNQLIEYSDKEQKEYLYVLLRQSNW